MRVRRVWGGLWAGLLMALLGFCFDAAAGVPTTEGAAVEAEAAALHAAIGERRLVLLGEKHGTREIPRFVAALLRQWPRDTPRVLALELPRGQQFALDAYFASDGGAAARAQLRASPWWHKDDDQHDGRRSEDMLDLLAAIHAERAAGAAIRVMGFDANPGTYADHHARDVQMAALLRAELARDDAVWLVLTGNVHAMRARPSYAPAEMQAPMGSLLADLAPFSVRIEAIEGAFWACLPAGCGPMTSPPRPQLRHGPLDDDAYDWQVVLPRLSVARLIGAGAH
jgi:hypothetical protein